MPTRYPETPEKCFCQSLKSQMAKLGLKDGKFKHCQDCSNGIFEAGHRREAVRGTDPHAHLLSKYKGVPLRSL